jgi:membrane-associated phospholipid phosphatase
MASKYCLKLRVIVFCLMVPFLFMPSGLKAYVNPESHTDSMRPVGIFSNIGGNTAKSFGGFNALYHLAGIAGTYVLIHQDVDYQVNRYFKSHRSLSDVFSPVVMTGSFLTPAIGAVCYFRGKHNSDRELTGLGSALLQAQIITSLYVGVLKGITGRPHPAPDSEADMKKLSRTFRFGLLRGGLFWGWPSGHTASTMALVSTLSAYYPEKTWIQIGGAALMAYTIIGVSAVGGGHMHWFSDAIAAAFMSYAIGHTVGEYYHKAVFSGGSLPGKQKIKMSIHPFSAFPVVRITCIL